MENTTTQSEEVFYRFKIQSNDYDVTPDLDEVLLGPSHAKFVTLTVEFLKLHDCTSVRDMKELISAVRRIAASQDRRVTVAKGNVHIVLAECFLDWLVALKGFSRIGAVEVDLENAFQIATMPSFWEDTTASPGTVKSRQQIIHETQQTILT